MSYFFWALGAIVFIVDDDVFRLLGISPIAKFLIFFVLLAVGVIFNRQHLGRSFSAMINPRRALSQVFEHSDKFSKKSDSKTKNNWPAPNPRTNQSSRSLGGRKVACSVYRQRAVSVMDRWPPATFLTTPNSSNFCPTKQASGSSLAYFPQRNPKFRFFDNTLDWASLSLPVI